MDIFSAARSGDVKKIGEVFAVWAGFALNWLDS